jgi:hypothetical protein
MSRLFITEREIAFINDITKEFIKDIVGQFIYYYPISTLKTQVHPIYEEAVEKIFENPIKLEVLAGQPEWETKANQFGQEQTQKIEIYIQARDLLDKGFQVSEGDFFVYGDIPFEIVSALNINNIFGQVEHDVGYKLMGRVARKSEFDADFFKKKLQIHSSSFEDSESQKSFEQQRGLDHTETQGATGDVREIRERLKDDMAEIALGEGPRKVTPDESGKSNRFYDDD